MPIGKVALADERDSDGRPLGSTPVAYVVFNRPRHTRKTFAAIRAYRPSQLFLIADGPHAGHPSDIERCREVRSIVSEIDWPCEVHRNFVTHNLGAGRRVSSGLDWVFSKVDHAIVLEDDCLASPDFFALCDDLLVRYRDVESVWVISGNSYQPEFRRGDGSYYFSRFPDTWGWATWRRAWRHYQHDLSFLDQWLNSQRWREDFPTRTEQRHFRRAFAAALSGAVNAWDYQWVGCVIYGRGLSATPNANLVRNIGFDNEATHTRSPLDFEYDCTQLGALIHPSQIAADVEADKYLRQKFSELGLGKRLLRRAHRFFVKQ